MSSGEGSRAETLQPAPSPLSHLYPLFWGAHQVWLRSVMMNTPHYITAF